MVRWRRRGGREKDTLLGALAGKAHMGQNRADPQMGTLAAMGGGRRCEAHSRKGAGRPRSHRRR
jgi:hypothetical protein